LKKSCSCLKMKKTTFERLLETHIFVHIFALPICPTQVPFIRIFNCAWAPVRNKANKTKKVKTKCSYLLSNAPRHCTMGAVPCHTHVPSLILIFANNYRAQSRPYCHPQVGCCGAIFQGPFAWTPIVIPATAWSGDGPRKMLWTQDVGCTKC